jgi:hypothetical protein
LAAHTDGIEDAPTGEAWADRHANWARQMPRDVTQFWAFVAELDHDSRLALFAHCVALTVNAVRLPWERKPRAIATADRVAEAVALDMTGYWRPTVRSYLGRVTKARILEAVREGVSEEAAERMADMKKFDMAEAAEQLLIATEWLPALLRTAKPVGEPVEVPTEVGGSEAYSEAAEWRAGRGRGSGPRMIKFRPRAFAARGNFWQSCTSPKPSCRSWHYLGEIRRLQRHWGLPCRRLQSTRPGFRQVLDGDVISNCWIVFGGLLLNSLRSCATGCKSVCLRLH